MDLTDRIRRRRRRGNDGALVLDYEPINPIAHVEEPTGRGPILERILDHLDPVFEGELPPNAYLWGPPGSGKTAIVTALFDHLGSVSIQPHNVIHTTTRAQTVEIPDFVHVDARGAPSEFQLYHAVLDDIVEKGVPQQGVSTAELRTRLQEALSDRSGLVVAVDHVGESGSLDPQDVVTWLGSVSASISMILVGRSPPADALDDWDGTEVEIPGYGQQVLIDILMTRGSVGLARDALTHSQARRIASWTGGNAHHALAALFSAADIAETAGRKRISDEDIEAGIEAVPHPCVSLGIVLALPENRQRVLRELIEIGPDARSSVTKTTEAIAATDGIDLSAGTVKRFLYELAEVGIVERVTAEEPDGHGRPPSRVELHFPTLVFKRLYDLQTSVV